MQSRHSGQSSSGPSQFGAQPFGAEQFGAQPFGAQPFGAQAFGAAPLEGVGTPPATENYGGQPFGLQPGAVGASTITPGAPFEPTPAFGVDSDLLVDEPSGGGRRRRKGRARATDEYGADADTGGWHSGNGSRRAVALLGIAAILGGAGFIGYTQLGGSADDLAASTPVTRVPAGAAPATGGSSGTFETPKQLGIFTQVSPEAAKSLTALYTSMAKQLTPTLPAPATVTGYHPAASPTASISVVLYAPSARNEAVYQQLVAQLSQPSPGSVSAPGVPVAAGASGGTMLCGSQRGVANSAWCAWKSGKAVGFLQTLGSSSQGNAGALTREFRAYAER